MSKRCVKCRVPFTRATRAIHLPSHCVTCYVAAIRTKVLRERRGMSLQEAARQLMAEHREALDYLADK